MAFPVAFTGFVDSLAAKDTPVERRGTTLTAVMDSGSDSSVFPPSDARITPDGYIRCFFLHPLPVSWSDPSCPFVRLVCFVLSPSISGFRSSMSSACYVSPTRYPLPSSSKPTRAHSPPQSSGHLSFVICRWLNDFPRRNIHYHTTTALVCEDKTSTFLCSITVTNGPLPSFRTLPPLHSALDRLAFLSIQ